MNAVPIKSKVDFYTAYPIHGRVAQKLGGLKAKFPFLEQTHIGYSYLGREITGIRLGNANRMILLAGTFHGQEWLTGMLLIKLLEELAFCCKEQLPFCGEMIGDSLSERGLLIVPFVNPDGTAIALGGAAAAGHLKGFVTGVMAGSDKSWQANARGIDLNHNFNAGFAEARHLEREAGIYTASPRQYGGAYPHSEPETRAMVNLISRFYFENVYAFHSQGEEIFYSYGAHTPPRSRYIAQALSQASGYKIVQNSGLCSHAGFKDYFIERTHRAGFTIEIGKGENPLPLSQLDEIYQKIKKALLMSIIL